MKQIKKTILTLVALLAVTTGAWAQTGENIFQYCYDCQRNPAYPTATASASLSDFANPNVGYKGSGFEAENTSAGPWKLEYVGLWSTTDNHGIEDFRVSNYQDTYNCTDVPVFRLYQWNATANEYQHASYGVVCCYAKVSNAVEHTAMFEAADGWGCVLTNSSHSSSMNITFDEDLTTGLTTLIAAASPNASGTPVDDFAWNAATKTGTFKMPGGNVTVSVEYYDLATLADNGLTAAVDAAAKTEAPLAVLAENAVTGGTLMYFVIYDENFSQADAIALAEDEWEAAIPTAETIEAAGTYYVWYYIKGDDEHSDTDPQRLAVTVLPEPTYAVTFADGVNPEPPAEPEWSAIPNTGVKKGETVTVTYTGQRKVMGVKAEKKASTEPTVTLTPGEIGDLTGWGSNSKTINGITIAVSGDAHFHTTGLMAVSAADPETGEPVPGAEGTFTFTSSVGKIKRIDINHTIGNWSGAGPGWSGSYNVSGDNNTFTWSGTPAASVTLNGSDNCMLLLVSSIVFTLEK